LVLLHERLRVGRRQGSTVIHHRQSWWWSPEDRTVPYRISRTAQNGGIDRWPVSCRSPWSGCNCRIFECQLPPEKASDAVARVARRKKE